MHNYTFLISLAYPHSGRKVDPGVCGYEHANDPDFTTWSPHSSSKHTGASLAHIGGHLGPVAPALDAEPLFGPPLLSGGGANPSYSWS